MGRYLRGWSGQAGRRVRGQQLLAEPLAGTGQTQPGRVGADAKRQGSFGGTQLPIGDQLQDLAIPDRHGPQRRPDMGRLACGIDRGLDGLVLFAGEPRGLPSRPPMHPTPAGQRPVLIRHQSCGDSQQPRGGRGRLGPVAASGPERGQEGVGHQVGHVLAGRATVDPEGHDGRCMAPPEHREGLTISRSGGGEQLLIGRLHAQ
jgi:hypothetical protein